MSITGQLCLPRPLDKVVAIHTLCPSQWYDECKITDPRFIEVAAIAMNTLATKHTPKQCGVYCHHRHAIKDVQPLHFPMEVDTPDDISYWIGQWSQNPIGMPQVIHEEDQGCLNEDDLDVWLWYRGIIPRPMTTSLRGSSGLWRDIFLTPGRFIELMGNPSNLHHS